MSSEPSRGLQAGLPVVGAVLGVLLFTVLHPSVVAIGGAVLFYVVGILLPAGLAYLFHPTLYLGARFFRSGRAIAPAGLAALGALLGLGDPLAYWLLPPIWATVGAVQIFKRPK